MWDYTHPLRLELINMRFTTADQFAIWVQQKVKQQGNLPEIAANGDLVLLKVVCPLLDRQLSAQAETFQNEGSFTERLYKTRMDTRNNPKSTKSTSST